MAGVGAVEYFLVIDTETSGLPQTAGFCQWYNPQQRPHAYDHSRVVEMAWVVIEHDPAATPAYRVVEQHTYLIQSEDLPHGIPNSHIHGITVELTMQEGVPRAHAFGRLVDTIRSRSPRALIGHNVQFDRHVIWAELGRLHDDDDDDDDVVELFRDLPTHCTMWWSRRLLSLSKLPKLMELAERLNIELPTDGHAHRALFDTQVCAQIALRLLPSLPVTDGATAP